MAATYTCAQCGETFTKTDPTDAEADMEATETWGVENASANAAFVSVCDDCYQLMRLEDHPELYVEEIERRYPDSSKTVN